MNQSNLNRQNNLSQGNVAEINKEIDSKNLAWKIAEAADDRKAEDIILLKVEAISFLADYFVIATGFSKAQLRAISDSIEEKMYQEFKKIPKHIEGKSDGNWILHDYSDVIVHLFLPAERDFYNLEAFWGGAEKIIFTS